MSAVQEADRACDDGSPAAEGPAALRSVEREPHGAPRRCLRQARRRLLERENARLVQSVRRLLDRWLERGRQLRRLRAVNALRSRALRRVGHECRSPLQSIFGLTTLLLQRSPGELTVEQEQLVLMIRKAADSLVELLDDFTDPAKLDAAHMALRPTQLDPAELLETLRAMLPPPLIKDGVRLTIENPAGMPWVYSDRSKVAQILRNLVNNALKFTHRGEVRVAAHHDAGRNVMIFAVHDTGPGIPYEQQRRLADPGSAPLGAHGRGLGLPLCHALAAVLGGRISLSSAPGQGSTFSLILPLRCEAAGSRRGKSGSPMHSWQLTSHPPDVHEER